MVFYNYALYNLFFIAGVYHYHELAVMYYDKYD